MKAVIMGLGASGRAAARVLLNDPAVDEVVGVDLRDTVEPIPGVRLELGPHRRDTFLSAGMIVMSPGIPPWAPDVVAAREAGIEVIGEVGYADRFLKELPRVGITGTNGKSTVTHFVGTLLAATGKNPFVGGNLGNSLSNAVGGSNDCLVVELSSYQLESAGEFRADVGVVLNLTPDHLARHKTMDGYAAAKAHLFDHTRVTDIALLPRNARVVDAAAHHGGMFAELDGLPGVQREGNRVEILLPDGRDALFDLEGLQVPGQHNLDNAATALTCCVALGAPASFLQAAIPKLTALPHRMRTVPSNDARVWINDSKSTNVDSTMAALRGRVQPTVLMLGGTWKGPGYGVLVDHLEAVHTVICFGEHGPDIAAEFEARGQPSVLVSGLADAVLAARDASNSGDHILFSPACASFDEFDDFEHRGRVFATLVGEL